MGKFYKKNDDGTYVEVTAFDQPEVDSIFKERLERETKKLTDQYSDYDDLKSKVAEANKKVEEEQSAKKTLEEQLQAKAKEVETEKLNTARVGIKHEFGLSDELEKFLIGDTPEDIRSNAELLKKGGAAAGVNIQKNNNDDGPKETPSKKLAGNLFGSAGE